MVSMGVHGYLADLGMSHWITLGSLRGYSDVILVSRSNNFGVTLSSSSDNSLITLGFFVGCFVIISG